MSVRSGSAVDLRTNGCSSARASKHYGEYDGSVTVSVSYTFRTDGEHQAPFVDLLVDGEPTFLIDSGFAPEPGVTETGRIQRTVPADGDVALTVGLAPSRPCEDPPDVTTIFEVRDVSLGGD